MNERLAELEIQLTHLQRTVEQLNEVVTGHADAMDQMQRRITQLESMVGDLKQAVEPKSDPLDEKPPHY